MITTLLLHAALAQSGTAENQLLVLRTDSSAKQKLHAVAYDFYGTGPTLGSATSGISKSYAAEGKLAVLSAFSVFHGVDSNTELAMIRENKKSGVLELRIVAIPQFGFAAKPKVIAFGTEGLGKRTGDGRVVAVCAADVDGLENDELVIVRAFDDGRQVLEIRNLPTSKKQPLAGPLAEDADFQPLATAEILAITRLDRAAPLPDRLVVLSRVDGKERLAVHALPLSVGVDVTPPLSYYADITAADGAVAIELSHLDADDVDGDEILIVREPLAGARRVERLAAPVALAQADPLPATLSLGSSSGFELFAVLPRKIEPNDPPPPPVFEMPNIVGMHTLRLTQSLDPLGCGLTAPCPLAIGTFSGAPPHTGFMVDFDAATNQLVVIGAAGINYLNTGVVTIDPTPNDGVVAAIVWDGATADSPIKFKYPVSIIANTPDIPLDGELTAFLDDGVVRVWPNGEYRLTGATKDVGEDKSEIDTVGGTLALGFWSLALPNQ